MSYKRFFFYALMLVPSLILTGVIISTVFDLYQIRHTAPDTIYRSLQTHLAQRETFSFPLPEDMQVKDPSKKTVFVFGSSDIILSDGEIFPRYLERRHPGLRVVNFGVSGIDSFSVRRRVGEALKVARPDLVVLYFGHNDYNSAYNEFILPNYFHRFHALLRLPYPFRNKQRSFSRFVSGPYNYYWFYVLNRPGLIKALQTAGLLHIDSRDFVPINELILEHFMRNTTAIMDLAARNSIPLVLVTPIGNLHAEPIGDLDVTLAGYRKGLASRDYHEALRHLRAAGDSEIFTFDVRAKSPLISYLRSLARPGVYVLDLEKKLEERRSDFGNADFVDFVHLNDRTHSLLADMLYDFMVKNRLTTR